MVFWRKKKKKTDENAQPDAQFEDAPLLEEAEKTPVQDQDLPSAAEESAEPPMQKEPEESAEPPAQIDDLPPEDTHVVTDHKLHNLEEIPPAPLDEPDIEPFVETLPELERDTAEDQDLPPEDIPAVADHKLHDLEEIPPAPLDEPDIEPFVETLPELESETTESLEPPSVPEESAKKPTQVKSEESAETIAQKKPEESAETPSSWFSRLTEGLSKSSNKISQGITDVLTKKKLDQDTLDELEDVLIMADLGPKTAARIVKEFSKDRFGKDIDEVEIKEALAETIADILRPVAKPLSFSRAVKGDMPQVILVCGVNGAGKTTTIGKMAHKLKQASGLNVMMAAGDTFRAAAVEQLEVWAKRAGSLFYKKDLGADAGAVAYEAYQKALEDKADVLLLDTAGRLQNKSNLMAELQKVVRVLKKQDEELPHDVLLVLDATTGQNAYEQVRIFGDMINVTGLAVTKLDGSAKGGVVVGLADQFGLPIHMVGVGEAIDDLQPFDPEQFARSLVGLA